MRGPALGGRCFAMTSILRKTASMGSRSQVPVHEPLPLSSRWVLSGPACMRRAEARNVASARPRFQVAKSASRQPATDTPDATLSRLTAGSDSKMTLEMSELVGALASVASVSSFAPQAWKVIRTRETSSLSSAMYGLTVAGCSLWLAYGIMLEQWPLIVTNGICLSLAAFILLMKLLPPSGRKAVAEAIDPNFPGG